MRISKPRNIVRQVEQSNSILKNQLNKLLELRARIGHQLCLVFNPKSKAAKLRLLMHVGGKNARKIIKW
jgi:hypothetical protein